MPFEPKELGQRLKQMREAGQITQDAVAKTLGVSRATITQIEAGNRPINTLQLEKLAKFYNSDISEFFSIASAQKQEAAAVFFRMTTELKLKINRKMLEPSLELLRQFTLLEKLLGIDYKCKHPVKYEYAVPRTTWEAIEEGQKIAEDERQRLHLGTRSINNIAELLEIQGIRILNVDMDENISGVFMGDEQIGLSIFVNPKHHIFRHAFTLAHEYCHVLVDRDRKTVISSVHSEKDLIEVRANAFSAAFLLPKNGVEEFFRCLGKIGSTRKYLSALGYEETFSAEQRKSSKALEIQLYDIVHLQHHYGMSWDATVYRLQNLGLISKDECQDFLQKKEAAQSLGRIIKLEPEEQNEEKKFEMRDYLARFFSLANDAYLQELISLAKLEELMKMIDIDFPKLRDFMKKTKNIKKK